jgi:hypothetical protein
LVRGEEEGPQDWKIGIGMSVVNCCVGGFGWWFSPVLAPLSLSPMQILPDAVGLMRNIDNHYNGNTLYLYLSRNNLCE